MNRGRHDKNKQTNKKKLRKIIIRHPVSSKALRASESQYQSGCQEMMGSGFEAMLGAEDPFRSLVLLEC